MVSPMRSFVAGLTNRSIHNKAMHRHDVKKGSYAIKSIFLQQTLYCIVLYVCYVRILRSYQGQYHAEMVTERDYEREVSDSVRSCIFLVTVMANGIQW